MTDADPEFEAALEAHREHSTSNIVDAAEQVRSSVLANTPADDGRWPDQPTDVESDLKRLLESEVLEWDAVESLRTVVEIDVDLVVAAVHALEDAESGGQAPGAQTGQEPWEQAGQGSGEPAGQEPGAVAEPSSTATYLEAALAATGELLTEVSTLQSRLSGVASRLGGQLASAANAVAGWLQSLQRQIKRGIGQKLWRLVSSHLTLDTWSLQGDAGVGLLGLQGSVGVQLDFTT